MKIDYSIDAKDIIENTISANYINRILLNELESIAVFWKSGLISIITLNTGFGYKILTIGNCRAVVEHVLKSRTSYPNTFSGFEELYNEIYKISTAEAKSNFRPLFNPSN